MYARVAAVALLSVASLGACSSDDSSPVGGTPDSGGSGSDAETSDSGPTLGPDATTVAPGNDGGRVSEGGSVEASGPAEAGPTSDAAPSCAYPDGGGAVNKLKYVFVIAMENHDSAEIIGNVTDAPYINQTLVPCYASSSNFNDPLPLAIPSEPHYVWMEAGTNTFSDPVTFASDNDPSAGNSTASTAHFSTQLDTAGVSWHSYQQGLVTAATGACPIDSSGDYAAKHDPYVFFQDVSGNPPSDSNARCAAHHSPLTALTGDLSGGTVGKYNFITPDLCHDMHGALDCANGNTVQAGDQFLQATLPALIAFAFANDGVIYVVWDEGDKGLQIPFLAIGPGVKRGYVGGVSYTHSSLIATNERVFGVPRLATVTAATTDFVDLFQAGALP
jgi:hypothetical protein